MAVAPLVPGRQAVDMQRASELFTDKQKTRIRDAVASAEAGTSAEVVPVVATASGRYDRPEDVVGLWLGLVCLGLAWWLLPEARAQAGSCSKPSGVASPSHKPPIRVMLRSNSRMIPAEQAPATTPRMA